MVHTGEQLVRTSPKAWVKKRSEGSVSVENLLAGLVDDLRPIENGYAARIYDCSREIQKTLGSNAAWAAVSMTTLGLVNKPKPEKEMWPLHVTSWLVRRDLY